MAYYKAIRYKRTSLSTTKNSLALLTLLIALVLLTVSWVTVRAHAQIAVKNQGYVPFSDAPIYYRTAELHDPVARLQRDLDDGKAHLEYEPQHGYLSSVLKLLKVPLDSQTLVFSKTSFQYKKISPEHPRALYFNDDVYVGSVHEGKAIEIVSFDPTQGAIFYLLDEEKAGKPTFQRAELDCTQCHIAAGTRGVPGVLLRSIYPTSTGTQAPNSKSYLTDQESPLSERWGGWYVTGKVGARATMANAAIASSEDTEKANVQRLVALSQPFDVKAYLVPDSDIVPHLVLAHQTQMHNLITLTNYKTRLALYSWQKQAARGGENPNAPLPENYQGQFTHPAEQLLRYLLFSHEASLASDGGDRIVGSTSFTKRFAALGPRDSKHRSLRDFDLNARIFRYPCSYLIYSEAFDSIPEEAKGYIYHRLLEVLTNKDSSSDFAHLSPDDRKAILEILLETKPGLPEEWQEYAKTNHLHLAGISTSKHRRG